jgi:hypothetical protein
MAATSDAPASGGKKFNLSKPGTKEYLIVGGVALAAALVYFLIKKRNAAAAAAATPADTTDTGTTAPSTPTGLSTAALMAWIQDHQMGTTTATTGGGGGTSTTGTATGGAGGTGGADYWQSAINLLRDAGVKNPTHAQIEAKYRQITPLAQRKKEEAANKAKGRT